MPFYSIVIDGPISDSSGTIPLIPRITIFNKDNTSDEAFNRALLWLKRKPGNYRISVYDSRGTEMALNGIRGAVVSIENEDGNNEKIT
jgi:hypothetical protein